MQQLLTGKKRFKKFENSEWKTHKLSELIELRHGYQFRGKDFVDSGVPVVKIGNVIGHNLDMNEADYVSPKRINEFKDVIIKNGDILMSLTGNIGRVIEVTGLNEPVFQNYRVGNFFPRSDAKLSKNFMKYVLQSPLLTNQLERFSNQSAQANFGKQDMDKLKMDFPSAIKEQQKIASVLSACDTEIQLLNDKLEALQKQKKGLMQQLLTGKVRVKVKD